MHKFILFRLKLLAFIVISLSGFSMSCNKQSGDESPNATEDQMNGQSRPHSSNEGLNHTISLKIISSDRLEFFETQVQPFFKRSCNVGGCHATSQFIDMTKFPFDYKSSLFEKTVIKKLGTSAPLIETQKLIVSRLIESVETFYMPPVQSTGELPTDSDLVTLKQWQRDSSDFELQSLLVTLEVTGRAQDREICRIKKVMVANQEIMQITREDCQGAEVLQVRVLNSQSVLRLDTVIVIAKLASPDDTIQLSLPTAI